MYIAVYSLPPRGQLRSLSISKLIVGNIHGGTLFSAKTQNVTIYRKVEGIRDHHMKWNKASSKRQYLICTHCRIYTQHTWYESSKWVFSRGNSPREGRKDQGTITGRKNETNIVCSLSYEEFRLKNTHTYICIYMYTHMHTLIYRHIAYESRKGTKWGNAGDQKDYAGRSYSEVNMKQIKWYVIKYCFIFLIKYSL